jgi:hypothetical protein
MYIMREREGGRVQNEVGGGEGGGYRMRREGTE